MGRRLLRDEVSKKPSKKLNFVKYRLQVVYILSFPRLWKVILKALAKDKAERFQNFEDLIFALSLSKELNIDSSSERIARYLRDLYGEDIEKRFYNCKP